MQSHSWMQQFNRRFPFVFKSFLSSSRDTDRSVLCIGENYSYCPCASCSCTAENSTLLLSDTEVTLSYFSRPLKCSHRLCPLSSCIRELWNRATEIHLQALLILYLNSCLIQGLFSFRKIRNMKTQGSFLQSHWKFETREGLGCGCSDWMDGCTKNKGVFVICVMSVPFTCCFKDTVHVQAIAIDLLLCVCYRSQTF